MRNEIESLDFWKKRIERARHGRKDMEHYAVYIMRPERWKEIEAVQASILKNTVSGRVLDAGCGYGRVSGLIDDYTGVDFSPDFIEWAKEANPGKNFMVADLKNLPFKDKEFDWVVAISIKEMVVGNLGQGEWEAMEKELKRVGKKVLIMKYLQPEVYEIL